MRAVWVVMLGLALAAEAHAGRGSAKCRAEAVAALSEAAGWHEAYTASVAGSFGEGFVSATGMVRTPESQEFVTQWWLPRLHPTFEKIWAVLEPEARAWWADRMTCRELQDAVASTKAPTPQAEAGLADPSVALLGEYEAWLQANLDRWIAPFAPEITAIVEESAAAFVEEARARGFLAP